LDSKQSSSKIKVGILFIFILTTLNSYAQNQIGLLPQINADFKIGQDWKVNSKLEGRQIFFKNPFPDGEKESEFERMDLELVATRSLNTGSIGGGYLIRRQDGKFLHRTIQQYSITQKFVALRLSHRFRTDQTFESDEPTKFRLRYRISLEKPLNGQEIDPKEFYLKFNNEYFGSLESSKGNLEIRGLASLGYNISDKNKFEVGADYRAEDLINSVVTHKLFLNIGWYHSF